jgi:translation initiation factor IF-2
MSNMRVFELAKEMDMPAKQLLQRIKKIGIPVSSNFNALTDEQIALIRKKIGGAASTAAQNKHTGTGMSRVISTRGPEGSVTETREIEGDALIGGKRPRRIRRKRNEEELESTTTTDAAETSTAETVETTEMPNVEVATEAEPITPTTPPQEDEPPTDPSPEAEANATAEAASEAPPEAEPLPAADTAAPPAEPSAPASAPAAETLQPPTASGDKKETESEAERKQRERKSEKKGSKHRHRSKAEEEEEQRQAERRRARKDAPPPIVPTAISEDSEEELPRRKQRKSEKRRDRRGREITQEKHVFNPRKKSIKIGNHVTVGELASLIGIKVPEILKKLMANGIMANINQSIPGETAALIATDFDVEVTQETVNIEDVLTEKDSGEDLRERAPIVTIMGHVDHGKTSLLDKIRSAKVTEGEAGGITQHIGAYHVEHNEHNITFLDTPGHEAFTAMRARGANVTDIVVLVVAADDRVQPQTVEAIHHAQAAEVPIIVAVNKVDKPDANPQKIEQELLEHNLVSEQLGGDTILVPVSAKSGEGIDNLLEMILLQAEVLELKAFHGGLGRGTIIESHVSRGKGAVGTVLIQRGTLRVGDFFLVGTTCGRVRAMYDDHGHPLKESFPAIPVEITGFDSVPATGETLVVMEDEKMARQIVQQRLEEHKQANASQLQKTNLENIFSRLEETGSVELNLLLKADVQGSVEALKNSLSQLGNEQVSVRFIHTGVGSVTETDVVLASASDAIIIAFNVTADAKAREARSREGVDMRLYDVIYNAIDDVKAALEGMLAPEIREEVIGHARVDKIFNANKLGMILGCLVTDGKILRGAYARISRGEEMIHEGQIASLKRFKDDVKEVTQNYECGIVLDFQEAAEGDIIEAYIQVEESATLS